MEDEILRQCEQIAETRWLEQEPLAGPESLSLGATFADELLGLFSSVAGLEFPDDREAGGGQPSRSSMRKAMNQIAAMTLRLGLDYPLWSSQLANLISGRPGLDAINARTLKYSFPEIPEYAQRSVEPTILDMEESVRHISESGVAGAYDVASPSVPEFVLDGERFDFNCWALEKMVWHHWSSLLELAGSGSTEEPAFIGPVYGFIANATIRKAMNALELTARESPAQRSSLTDNLEVLRGLLTPTRSSS